MSDDVDLSGMDPPGIPLGDIGLGRNWRLLVHWITDGDGMPSVRLWKLHRFEGGEWELARGPSLFVKGEKALEEIIFALDAARRLTGQWVRDAKFNRPPRRRDW